MNGLCVLFVDDDERVRMAMQGLLESWGCRSRAVESERSAIELVASGWAPELMIADYQLGAHRTGSEAIARIRERFGKALPAFILTGETDSERIREIEANGFEVLQKPLDESRLRAAIQGALARAACS